MNKITTWAGSAALATALFGSAASAAVINNIEVRGLNRITLGAVLLTLPIKPGDEITSENTALAMKRLYQTGDFDDVSLSRDGDTLIVEVKERPTIGHVEFAGNKQIDKNALKNVIEQQGLRPGEPLNAQTLTEIQKSLIDFYHGAGMYQASVKPVLTYLPRNRVDVKLEFNEGVAADIDQINIVGNKSFDEDVLLAQMQLRDDVPWWNLMANQRYDSQKFRADLESLRTYYTNRGFVKFEVTGTSVEITPDKKGIYLTINVNEGDRYTIGKTSLRGNTLTYGPMMEELIDLDEGDVYNAADVTATEKALQDFLGKFGYAYSRVHAYPTFNEAEKSVDLEFAVEPGSRVYVSQVFVKGNTITDDTVVRREIRQMDGTWLSSEAVELSKNRLNRLGFFETVDINTVPAGVNRDTANLETVVKEQPTGSISGGIGYGTDSGLMIQGGISQNNVFGWGSRATLMAYKNDYRHHAEVSYTDPYFTVDHISLGGRLSYDSFDGNNADVINYDNKTVAFDITSGYPLNETMSVGYSLGVQWNKIENDGRRFLQGDYFWRSVGEPDKQKKTFVNYNAGFTFTRNNLDRTVFPTSGSMQNFSAMATIPGSDLKYYKLSADTAHYLPIDRDHDFVLSFRGRVAYGDGYGKKNGYNQRLPFFENYYLGGSQWLRGFDHNSIGPRAIYVPGERSDDALGGNALWAVSFEFSVPTPFIAEAYRSQVRTAFFYDAGCLWDTHGKDYRPDYSDPHKYRASVGIAFKWLSPIGPLTFSFAKAVKDYSGDKTEVFNFDIGGQF